MKCHVTGMFWTLDKKAKPFLELTKEDKSKEYVHLKRNTTIKVLNEFGKKCTGYFENGEHKICPDNLTINYGKQCSVCRSKDSFNICASCDGSKCSATEDVMKKCLSTTHFLYLVLIGEKVKVGITSAGRYLKRWIEQGADYACLIGSDNGLNIRALEKNMAKEVTDRISTSAKIKSFMKDDRELLAAFLKEKNMETNITNVRKFYEGLDSIPKTPCVHEGLVNGRVVCVKGKILIFENNENYYYYDLNNLIGEVVDAEFTYN
ncbi:Uncharacterised protein [Candidatus Tiddalikarchaeum anstoanum]|nr:Uncharacterised protein [Candidatus Tiddalikarchaeum anstoanum]